MFNRSAFRSRTLAGSVIGAVLLLITPFPELALAKTAAPEASGSLVGFVYAEDSKTPVANAVVKIRDLRTAREYASLPTDADGMYKITGITEGRYVLGVTTPAGDFNFNYLMGLKGKEIAKLSVSLSAKGGNSGQGDDAGSKRFFGDNWAGLVVLAGLVGAVLYNVFEENGGAKSRETSPIR